MREKEQKLWDRMRHSLKDKVYMERIENVVSPGRPDIDTLWEGIVLPVELKAIESWPARMNTPVLGGRGLNQNQLNWWLNWKRWGGSGFIVVDVALELFVIPARLSDQVNRLNYSQLMEFRSSWVGLLTDIKTEAQCLRNR